MHYPWDPHFLLPTKGTIVPEMTTPSEGRDEMDDIEDILKELDAYEKDEQGKKKASVAGKKGSALQAALFQVREGDRSILDLSHWSIRLGNDGVCPLAESLQRGNQRLTSVLLDCNDIGPKGATALATMLQSNRTLTRLHLSSNAISDSGAASIASALRANSTLTCLNLDSNSIGASGASSLAEALKANRGLESLYLSDNNILDSGASAFAGALNANSCLTTLWIDGNKIGVAGGCALSAALKNNSVVHTIHLGSPKVGSSIHVYSDQAC